MSDASASEKKTTLHTLVLTDTQVAALRALLAGRPDVWEPFSVDYALFAFRGDKVNVVCYKAGKLVVQGKRTEDFVTDTLEPQITGKASLGYDEVHHPEWYLPHAGLDESGKGDLFGSVVSACVIAPGADVVRRWVDAGVRDSKAIASEASIFKLETIICQTPGATVRLMSFAMPKYNELYDKFGKNLNRLLAWMHARTLEAALKVRPVPMGMLDQFSPQPLVQRQLKVVPEGFVLNMRTKAEEDPVVAAASIVARAEYVRQMQALSALAGEPLLKGASGAVKAQAKRLVEKLGPERLGEFAKLHFRTAYEALGLPVPAKKLWGHRTAKD